MNPSSPAPLQTRPDPEGTRRPGYGARGAEPLRRGTPEEAGMSPERIQLIERRAQEWVDAKINQALVLLVARHGVVVLHKAFGRLYPEPDAPPVLLDTIFPISSISKVITATAVMCLVEDGLLGLNRPVQEYVPEFTGEGKEAVMVHHLLTHTSGWDEDSGEAFVDERRGKVEIPPCPETQHPAVHEWVCLACGAPLVGPPGQEMRYSSPGYNLLGEIVRRVSGKSLDDFARERIFEPLGMHDTFYVLPEEAQRRVVRRRPLDPPPFGLDSSEYHREPWPESGVLSTAMDQAIFTQIFLNGGSYGGKRVLSPAAVTEMTRDQIPGVPATFRAEFFPEAGWSYGWSVKANKKAPRSFGTLVSPAGFGHGGSGGVFVWADPTYDLIGVYLSTSRLKPGTFVHDWCLDLFSNMATAAVTS
jgi:serine-type D-Ala-D-Ala carboxypeptidase